MTRRRFGRFVAGIIASGALVAAGVMFGPRPVGPSSFVAIARGSSMEPRFHAGDLVVVHRAASYHTGEMIAFHSDIGRVVFHRIIGVNGDRYITRGDNNDFTDPYQPSNAEVIGKKWWAIRKGGAVFAWLRKPQIAGGLAGILALVVAGGFGVRRRRRRPARERTGSRRLPALPAAASVAATFGVLAISAGALAAFAYARPARTAEQVGYSQSGSFAYRAPTTSGVYGGKPALTGQPVFFRLSNTLGIAFTYRFASDVPHAVGGDWRLVAQISAQDGWSRTLPISGPTGFSGDTFTASGRMDLQRLQAIIEELERSTGVANAPYSLTLQPQVRVRGTVATRPLAETFLPTLQFHVDRLQAQIDRQTTAADPFVSMRDGKVQVPDARPAELSWKNFHLSVRDARRFGATGAAAAGVIAMIAFALWFFSRGRDEVAQIERRYGRMLIAVTRGPATDPIDVESFDDLARLAEGAEEHILFVRHTRSFWLRDREVTYRYRVSSPVRTLAEYEPPVLFKRDVVALWPSDEPRVRTS